MSSNTYDIIAQASRMAEVLRVDSGAEQEAGQAVAALGPASSTAAVPFTAVHAFGPPSQPPAQPAIRTRSGSPGQVSRKDAMLAEARSLPTHVQEAMVARYLQDLGASQAAAAAAASAVVKKREAATAAAMRKTAKQPGPRQGSTAAPRPGGAEEQQANFVRLMQLLSASGALQEGGAHGQPTVGGSQAFGSPAGPFPFDALDLQPRRRSSDSGQSEASLYAAPPVASSGDNPFAAVHASLSSFPRSSLESVASQMSAAEMAMLFRTPSLPQHQPAGPTLQSLRSRSLDLNGASLRSRSIESWTTQAASLDSTTSPQAGAGFLGCGPGMLPSPQGQLQSYLGPHMPAWQEYQSQQQQWEYVQQQWAAGVQAAAMAPLPPPMSVAERPRNMSIELPPPMMHPGVMAATSAAFLQPQVPEQYLYGQGDAAALLAAPAEAQQQQQAPPVDWRQSSFFS